MDRELKQYLDGKFTEIDKRFIEERAEREAMEVRLKGHMEKIETSLLTEFHKWAHTYEVRSRGTTAAVGGLNTMLTNFDERLGLIEERLAEVERRTYPRVT